MRSIWPFKLLLKFTKRIEHWSPGVLAGVKQGCNETLGKIRNELFQSGDIMSEAWTISAMEEIENATNVQEIIDIFNNRFDLKI